MSLAAWPACDPAEVPELPVGRPLAHVWLAGLSAPLGENVLSPEERARAAAFAAPESRELFIASRIALRRILAGYTGAAPAETPIRYPAGGKPCLGCPGPDFNLSHSGDRMLVAVCAGAGVGVDIEGPRDLSDALALARRFLPREDAAAIEAAAPEDRPAFFLRRWTRLEAFLKATGTGIAKGLGTRPDRGWSLFDLPADPGWFAALAVGSPDATWRGFRLEMGRRALTLKCSSHA